MFIIGQSTIKIGPTMECLGKRCSPYYKRRPTIKVTLPERGRQHAFAGAEGGEVCGFGVVDDDRDRGLLRHELARFGYGQTDLLAWHEAEEYPVIFDIWTGGIAPRISLALTGGQT
jgi:hypothetical protein